MEGESESKATASSKGRWAPLPSSRSHIPLEAARAVLRRESRNVPRFLLRERERETVVSIRGANPIRRVCHPQHAGRRLRRRPHTVSLISDWLPLRAVVDEDLSRCVEADDDDVAFSDFSDRVPSIFSRTSVRLLARPLRAQPAHT